MKAQTNDGDIQVTISPKVSRAAGSLETKGHGLTDLKTYSYLMAQSWVLSIALPIIYLFMTWCPCTRISTHEPIFIHAQHSSILPFNAKIFTHRGMHELSRHYIFPCLYHILHWYSAECEMNTETQYTGINIWFRFQVMTKQRQTQMQNVAQTSMKRHVKAKSMLCDVN